MVSQYALLLAWTVLSAADDTVVYVTGQDGRSRARVVGEIVDYTGAQLRIRQTSGREATIPADRVMQVHSQWTPQQKSGDELLAAGKFTEALGQYEKAAQVEHRSWVRRRIVAQQVRCLQALGNIEQAGTMFLSLCAADPATLHFDAIPLTWRAHQPTVSLERQAKSWLDGGQGSVATLIAASWLLSTPDRRLAIEALQQLSNAEDSRIAHLSDAQLWRTRTVTAKSDEIQRWQKQIERMPKSLRGGPYFILGQALAYVGQHQDAALAFMRIPILYPQDRQLSADGLHAAGRQLEQLGKSSEAVGLYREIVTEYADATVAAEATARLEALTKGTPNQ